MWLLEASVRQTMLQAQKAGVMPTVEQQENFEASRLSIGGESSRILSVAGSKRGSRR